MASDEEKPILSGIDGFDAAVPAGPRDEYQETDAERQDRLETEREFVESDDGE